MEERPVLNLILRHDPRMPPSRRNDLFGSIHVLDMLDTVLKDGGQDAVQSLHFRPNIVIRVSTEPGAHNNIEDNHIRKDRRERRKLGVGRS